MNRRDFGRLAGALTATAVSVTPAPGGRKLTERRAICCPLKFSLSTEPRRRADLGERKVSALELAHASRRRFATIPSMSRSRTAWNSAVPFPAT